MAGRKKEIQIQTPIHNEMEWDEMFEAKGLSVVDVHQGWCGPCKAILSMFRRLKMEFGDELLHFHTVEASLIPLLKGFEGKCEPAFLFIVAGKIADYVKGVNAPVINKIIVAFLEGEVEFYEKGVERQEVKTIQLYDVEDEVEEFMQAAISKQVEILFTILVIKPNAIITGNDNIIKEQISEAGFQIMAEEMAHLTEEEAKELYEHKKHQRNYEEIVQTMSSGVCDVLLLSEEGEIKDFEHEFDVQEAEIAKTNDEDSDISELAYRLFSFFFPTVYEKFKKTEKTLAIIRPQLLELQKGIKDAKAKGIIKSSEGELQDSCFNTFMTNILIHDEILEEITNARFTIGRQKEINLSEHQVTKFYTLNEKSDLLPEFIEYMISGPILVLALSRDNAIQHWRNLLGPHDLETAKQEYPLSLRARFAFEDVPFNQLHGSHDAEMAKKELQYFFPFEHTLVAIKPVAIREYKDAIIVRIREAKFTISAIKPVEMSQETAAEFYKDYEEEQFFNQLIENMSQGPTVMMILTKENAVRDWRELMGPADPELAKTSFPNSLRAQFDTSILQNGLHGSSTVKHAKQYIQLFFGDTLLESFGVHLDEELSISTTDLQTKSPSAEPSTTAIEPSDLVDVDAPIDQQEVTTSEAMLAPESQDVSAPTEAPDAGTGEIRAPGEAPDNRQEEISAPTEAPDAGTEEISATGEATDAGPEEISAPTEAPDAGTEEISATGEATDAGPEEISAPTEAPDAGTEDIPTPGEAPDADREEIPASGEAPDVGTQDVSAPGETPNASTKDVTSPGEAPDAGTGEISAPDEAPAVGTEEISAPVEAPEAGTEEISAPVEAPEAGAEEISAPGEAPEAGTEEISAPVEAPEAGTEEISAPGEAPEAGTEEISAPVEAPEAGTEEISAPGEAPEAGTEEISAPGEAPEAGTEEISAPGEAPEAGTEEISAPGEAPEAGTEEISAPGEAPEAGTEEISAPGEAPEAGTEEISAPGEAPDAGTKDVSAPPEVPETDIADVSASSKSSDTSSQDVPPPAEEPDAGTEEVSAPSEVPDAGTQDVSAPTEAPDAGNEDVSARTETPDAGNEHVSARTEAPDVSTEHVSARTEAPDVSTDHVSAPTETTDAGNKAVSAPGEDPAAGTKDVSAPTEAP